MTSYDFALANSIKSATTYFKIQYECVLFGTKSGGFKRDPNCKKGPQECAFEYADAMQHPITISYTFSKGDHRYGSYISAKKAAEVIKRYSPNAYEVLRIDSPVWMYADFDFNIDTLIYDHDQAPLSIKEMVEKYIAKVQKFAEELVGRPVSKKVQICNSRGECISNAWLGIDKGSFHVKFEFAFSNTTNAKGFVRALSDRVMKENLPYERYIKNGIIEPIMDGSPYKKNQCWRTLYSMKPDDEDSERALRPVEGSSNNILDHFVGMYDDDTLKDADILSLNFETAARTRGVRVQKLPNIHEPSTSNATSRIFVPKELFFQVCQNLSANRSVSYMNWSQTIWCMFNVSYENDYLSAGLECAHAFSKRSGELYDPIEVDAVWAYTTYRQDGLSWGTLRGWLFQDNKAIWKKLRADKEYGSLMAKDRTSEYAEQYLPHPDRYPLLTCESYCSPEIKPFDLSLSPRYVDHAAMNTKKTFQMVNLIVSRRFRSIIIYVNRQTLCRSLITRINTAICQKLGYFDPDLMFVDYRRPDDIVNPMEARVEDIDIDELFGNQNWGDGNDDKDDEETRDTSSVRSIDLNKRRFVVIQMESGWKIEGPAPELLVGDEFTSDLSQLSSSTMKKLRACADNFKYYMMHATYLIVLDAFISDQCFGCIVPILEECKDKRILYRRNTWLPDDRHSYSIEGKSSSELQSNTKRAILAQLGMGHKVTLFTASNKFGCEMARAATEVFPAKRTLYYNKNTDGCTRDRHFDNVDLIWSHADFMGHTPVLLAGPSFNVHNHFYCAFIYAPNISCSVRDMFQAAGRVRKYESNTLYYALDTYGPRPWSLPTTYDSVKSTIIAEGKINKKFLGEDKEMLPGDYINPLGRMLWTLDEVDLDDPDQLQAFIKDSRRLQAIRAVEKTPEWLLDVHIRNTWEQYLTHNPVSFPVVFSDFLRLTGWKDEGTLTKDDIKRWENLVRRETGEPQLRVKSLLSDVHRDYADIQSITRSKAKEIEGRRNRGTARTSELLELEKHWFDTVIVKNHRDTEELRKNIFNRLDDRKIRSVLENLWAERSSDLLEQIIDQTFANPYEDLVQEPQRLISNAAMIRQIMHILGLKNTQDSSSIQQQILIDNYSALLELVNSLKVNLKIANSRSNNSQSVPFLQSQISSVLNSFAKCKLMRKQTGSHKNGKSPKLTYSIHVNEDYVEHINILLN